ncbi:MAG: hypothetical protein LAO76_15480 [Acidobacteriia bacterium]|nr:hypothetical protein [Terriglobia bacterium]
MSNQDSDPKLRHEFVGMMFAVTIAEVGLQIAALVQAGHFVSWIHFLPEYAHLLLATVVIATSWVGWTLSRAPGARHDVKRIFQWEFLVLLLDVALVILYFILVRSVDFEKDQGAPRTASASKVGLILCWIFILYILWDILTKGIIYLRDQEKKAGTKWCGYYDKDWRMKYGSRMVPALVCLVLAGVMTSLFGTVDRPYLLTADLAFVALALLFRALKDVMSALYPSDPLPEADDEKAKAVAERETHKKSALLRLTGCALLLVLGVLWTKCSVPLPAGIVKEIRTEPPNQSHSENSAPTGQTERPGVDQKR